MPVTTGEFLEFVRANPRWQRSHIERLFADESYLKNWAGDLDPGPRLLTNSPVTFVSWFAANAYAEWQGKRLPTVAEWEYVASAGVKSPYGTNEPALNKQVLEWYSSPSPAQLGVVGHGQTNFWGIHDLNGLVWEWVGDFNTAMVTGDARGDTGPDSGLFCGAGAVGAKDVANFPAFMRYGFRSSLKADYCVHNLGFRCASDAEAEVKTPLRSCCAPALASGNFSGKSLYQTASLWTTDAGVRTNLASLSGKPQVIVMFFARCQAACPILVNDVKNIEAALPASLRGRVGFTLASFDEKNDTPETLKKYRNMRDLDENWTLLSGNSNGIMELAGLLGVRYQAMPGGTGFQHSNQITILNANGEIVHQMAGLIHEPHAAVEILQNLLPSEHASAK